MTFELLQKENFELRKECDRLNRNLLAAIRERELLREELEIALKERDKAQSEANHANFWNVKIR